jgi:tetratricopeptide (TPR) repeat protein
MTMHTDLQHSFRGFYTQAGRADLVEQVPEVESQDGAYARWQAKTADRSEVERIEARYQKALALENRAFARLGLYKAVEVLAGLALGLTPLLLLAVFLYGRDIEQKTAVALAALAVLVMASTIWWLKTRATPAKALREYESLLAECPDFANAACRKAMIWQVERPHGVVRWKAKQVAAERSLDEAVRASEADPNFELAHFLAGMALKILGRPDEAAVAYRKVIALNPRFAAARGNLGLILVDKKDFEGAVEQFTAMLRDLPDARNAITNLSLAEKEFTRDGHTQEEFQELARQVIGHAPDALQLLRLLTQGGR